MLIDQHNQQSTHLENTKNNQLGSNLPSSTPFLVRVLYDVPFSIFLLFCLFLIPLVLPGDNDKKAVTLIIILLVWSEIFWIILLLLFALGIAIGKHFLENKNGRILKVICTILPLAYICFNNLYILITIPQDGVYEHLTGSVIAGTLLCMAIIYAREYIKKAPNNKTKQTSQT